MRTVAWLKNELSKFSDDALCYAYEGEIIGIVVEMPDYYDNQSQGLGKQGVIYCSEYNQYDQTHETELI